MLLVALLDEAPFPIRLMSQTAFLFAFLSAKKRARQLAIFRASSMVTFKDLSRPSLPFRYVLVIFSKSHSMHASSTW
jgi:hypothetical protein